MIIGLFFLSLFIEFTTLHSHLFTFSHIKGNIGNLHELKNANGEKRLKINYPTISCSILVFLVVFTQFACSDAFDMKQTITSPKLRQRGFTIYGPQSDTLQ